MNATSLSGVRPDDHDLVERLEAAFGALRGQYHARKTLAEAAAVEWRWSSFKWFDVRPLFFEQNGFAPGRRLRNEPPRRPGHPRVCCGEDRNERVVVERDYNDFGFYETFYNYDQTPLERARYDYGNEKKPNSLLVAWFEGGHITVAAAAAGGGFVREEYAWHGAQITEVRVSYSKRDNGVLTPLKYHHAVKPTYGEGRLSKVQLIWPPSKPSESPIAETMFERRGNRIWRRHP